jgi:phage terminase small subunit
VDKPEVVKRRPLTTKQRNFIKEKASGKTGVAAAQAAYGVDYNSARSIASQNLSKLNIQEAVQAEMAKQGITLEAIIAPVKDALSAEKVAIVGNGDQAMAEVTADHSVRLKAVSIASQFMGINKQSEKTPMSVHFHNHQEKETSEYGL